MTVTITATPTGEFEGVNGTRCRIWRCETSKGEQFRMFVAMVQVPKAYGETDLHRALEEIDLGSRDLVYFDNRMVLP